MNRMRIACLLLLGGITLLSACSPTRLVGTWQDEGYRGGRFHKALVLGVTDEGAVRRVFEQSFAEKLRSHGAQALTSSGIFPSEEKVEKDDILAKVAEYGVDALIVTRVVRRQQETEQRTDYDAYNFYDEPWRYRHYDRYYHDYYDRPLRPRYYSDWYGYYSHSREYTQARTYTVEYQIITAETNLYDTRSGELVWTGLAETTIYGNAADALESYTRTMAEKLAEAGLI